MIKFKSILVVVFCCLIFGGSKSEAQDFNKVIAIVDEMENSLKAMIAKEEMQRQTEISSLQKDVQNLQVQIQNTSNSVMTNNQQDFEALTGRISMLENKVNNPNTTPETNELAGQHVNVGADFVSRYVWRGLDIANSPSLQPTLSISVHNVELGFWGAYSLFNDKSVSDEIDTWIGYSLNNDLGEFSFTILDYYYPNAGRKLSNLKNGEGAHTLEGMIYYSGPFSFLLGYNFYNDPGNNTYVEIGYPIENEDLSLNFFVGITPGSKTNPGYYGAEKFSFINAGVKVVKEIKITENFVLPVFSTLIINPKAEIAHLVFGISL